MKCNVCNKAIDGDKKYVIYLTSKGQIIMCTSCVMTPIRHGSGAIMTKYGVLDVPTLFFSGADAEAKGIAVSEGWVVDGDPTAPNVYDITEHWYMAQTNYWFVADGKWKKSDMTAYDCFRRSCQTIRDNFSVWYAGSMVNK